MSGFTIQNARVVSTHLGNEDHGIPTAMVFIEGQGGGGGFGGYDLRHHGINYVTTLLSVLCVPTWEKLPGTYVRAVSHGIGHRWLALGHVIDDRWFICDELGPRVITETALRNTYA